MISEQPQVQNLYSGTYGDDLFSDCHTDVLKVEVENAFHTHTHTTILLLGNDRSWLFFLGTSWRAAERWSPLKSSFPSTSTSAWRKRTSYFSSKACFLPWTSAARSYSKAKANSPWHQVMFQDYFIVFTMSRVGFHLSLLDPMFPHNVAFEPGTNVDLIMYFTIWFTSHV